MSWTNNKVLLEYTEHTPCREIFQAVCDEIGNHYQNAGFKYSSIKTHSRLNTENEKLKLEIKLWPSSYSTPGETVGLEIIPSFTSKQLEKLDDKKGFIIGHTGILYHKYTDDKSKIRVNQIFGDVLERTDPYSHESKIIDNHYCNVYGIDKEKFDKIINFIDTKILSWLPKLQTKEGILELLKDASPTRVGALSGMGTNSRFVRYVKLNFPDIDVEKELGISSEIK